MPDAVSQTPRGSLRALLVTAAVCALLLGGTLTLWARYGTAVFFEMIRTGFVACFG